MSSGLLPSASNCCDPCEYSTRVSVNLTDLIDEAVVSRLSIVSVADHGAVGDGVTDDRAAFLLAIAEADSTSKKLYIPEGEYVVSGSLSIPAGLEVFGAGMSRTTILQTAGSSLTASTGTFFVNSGSSATQVDGIYIHDLTLDGQSDSLGFSEFIHLISLNGVSNTYIERVKFRAFRGDGVYIGSGNVAGQERHNTNVWVRWCVFDGVDYSNRNAVSCIDWHNVYVVDNYITRCTTTTMPGPIDFEPDFGNAAFAVCKNAVVERNHIYLCGGLTGKIIIYIPFLSTGANDVTGFRIRDNLIEGTAGGGATTGLYVRFFEQGTPTLTLATQFPHDVEITNNRLIDLSSEIYGVRTLLVRGNTFTGTGRNSLVVGSLDTLAEGNVIEPFINDNLFIDTGAAFGATTIGLLTGLRLTGNHYRNIASAEASRYGIVFLGSGVTTTSEGYVTNNTFSGTFTAQIHQASNTTTTSNTFLTNNYNIDGTPITATIVANFGTLIQASPTATNNIALQAESGVCAVRDGAGTLTQVSASTLRLGGQVTVGSEGVNVVGIRDGVNAVAVYAFNTWTSGADYERAGINWNTNICSIGTQAAGGGTLRALRLVGGTTVSTQIGAVLTMTVDADATAGNTRLLIWDVDSGQLERVRAGANGTGPGGVGRALYIDDV